LRTAAVLGAVVLCAGASCSRPSSVRPTPPPVGPPPVADSQPATDAPLFIGSNAFADPLAKQTPAVPALGTVRVDGANSAVVDSPAPLGQGPVTGSNQTPLLAPMLWDRRGGLSAGCQVELVAGKVTACLAAVDPATLAVTARWIPPGQDLNVSHAVVDDQQRVVVTSRQNHVLVVQRPEDAGSLFRLVREVDVSSALGTGEVLRAATVDRRGYVWFSTGGPPIGDAPAATTTTIGYITPTDQVVVTHLVDQVVENDLAVGQDGVFVATAPAGAADRAAAAGYVYGLTASSGPSVQLVWRERYDAGGSKKPGGSSRGTGSGVVVLGSRFVAVTDNADSQVHLLVFAQGTPAAGVAHGPDAADPRLLCRVPLFIAGASAVNAAPIGYDSESGDSVIVANGYGAPGVVAGSGDVNGPANNMSGMAPGLTRVDLPADGSACQVGWTLPVRMKSGPLLSSATGLLYGYTQDEQRASRGSYVWYFVAADYRSGRIAWQQRVGAGGTKNDNFLPLSLGPDATLYQVLSQGVVWMRDVAPRR